MRLLFTCRKEKKKKRGKKNATLGFVWIRLILLKLKTYYWNHCSKIIFKCVNSTVGPIFNEKIDKKWNLWVRKQCTDALFTGKSQYLRLLFMYCSLNSSRIPPKTREKKKKNEKNENAASPKCRRRLSAIQTSTKCMPFRTKLMQKKEAINFKWTQDSFIRIRIVMISPCIGCHRT